MTSEGDAWVANRGLYYPSQDTVVKIFRESFVDRNGNGIVDTSQDFNGDGRISRSEMLPWDANSDGQPDDERIALSVPVGRVQDHPEVLRIDGIARAVAIDANDDVWVGLDAHRQYEVYDGQTGEFKAIVPTPGNPYGAVIDGEGQLWGSSIAQGSSTILTRPPTPMWKGSRASQVARTGSRWTRTASCGRPVTPGKALSIRSENRHSRLVPGSVSGTSWCGGRSRS